MAKQQVMTIMDAINMAINYNRNGNFEEAKNICKQILKVDKNDFNALHLLGFTLNQLENYDEAIKNYKKAIKINPNSAELYNNLGLTLYEIMKIKEAIKNYKKAIELNPNFAEAYLNLALAFANIGNHNSAINNFEKAIKLNPNFTEAYNNLGNSLKYKGMFDKSLKNYEYAISLNSDFIKGYKNLSHIQLLLGDFKNGWQNYKYRYSEKLDLNEKISIPKINLPYWQGEDLKDKTILLLREQGIGDEIFFLRFAKELKKMDAKIIYNPSKKIKTIIERCEDIDKIVEDDELNNSNANYVLPIGDLPLLLKCNSIDKIPPPLKLTPLKDKIDEIKDKLKNINLPIIGITWRAGTKKFNKLYKEIYLKELAKSLKDINGIFIILQREPIEGEIKKFEKIVGKRVYDFSYLNDDLEGMLALLSLLDNYIGVSNTNIHLSASLDKKCNVLIPNPLEWRWMSDSNSPWFKDFKIYRQDIDMNWKNALDNLVLNLKGKND